MWCLFQQVGGVTGNVDFAVDVETANIDNITIVVQVSTLHFLYQLFHSYIILIPIP